jgi:hypothetical protein
MTRHDVPSSSIDETPPSPRTALRVAAIEGSRHGPDDPSGALAHPGPEPSRAWQQVPGRPSRGANLHEPPRQPPDDPTRQASTLHSTRGRQSLYRVLSSLSALRGPTSATAMRQGVAPTRRDPKVPLKLPHYPTARPLTAPLQPRNVAETCIRLLRSARAFRRGERSGSSTWLVENLLVKADRMTMACSLEFRVPFLVHHLVQWGDRRQRAGTDLRSSQVARSTRWLDPDETRRQLPLGD